MGRQKKRFDCGHRGFGKFCHRCADQQRLQQQQRLRKQEKLALRQRSRVEWIESFEYDRVDLRDLPKSVVLKARRIIQGLVDGQDYRRFKGKRLRFCRSVLRIPVTRRYRLICDWIDDQWVPRMVLSHEAYNPMVRSKNRL